MPDKSKYSLSELHEKSDEELSGIIRSAIIEFKKQQQNGVEGIMASVGQVNDAIVMIAIQELDNKGFTRNERKNMEMQKMRVGRF